MEKAINIPNEPETQNETESDLVVVLCNGQSKDNEIEKKTYKSTNPPVGKRYWTKLYSRTFLVIYMIISYLHCSCP